LAPNNALEDPKALKAHQNYGGISESHACKDCVWPIILDAGLYTTCPGERVLVVMTHQV